MVNPTCPCCGQTAAPTDQYGLYFTSTQALILRAVQRAGKHGIHSESLFTKVYGNRIDGGPDSGIKVIHVHVAHLNGKLAAVGKRIRGSKDQQVYVLQDIT